MGVLIDSGVFIAHERGKLDLEQLLRLRGEEEFYLSVISASELLHGVHRAASPSMRATRLAWVNTVFERFPLLDVDLRVARIHAEVWARLASAGTIIGSHDLWIAATAIAHGLSLITTNPREFSRVDGLEIEVCTHEG